MTQERSLDNLSLEGGWLCLDFINTVHDRTVPNPHEYLATYAQLLKWVRKTHALPEKHITDLVHLRKKEEKIAEKVLFEIINAREILHRLFAAIAIKQQPAEGVTSAFNKLLALSLPNLTIQFSGVNTVDTQWKELTDLQAPLYPVIKSAYDLLTSDKLDRVKACGGCGWLFLDKSKNSSRRWCDMQTCGSSVKAKKYYKKKKTQTKQAVDKPVRKSRS